MLCHGIVQHAVIVIVVYNLCHSTAYDARLNIVGPTQKLSAMLCHWSASLDAADRNNNNNNNNSNNTNN